jgi:acetyltransferase-like isoleucine patch superfamily enzyme
MKKISETSRILKNTKLSENITIEDFCVIGMPPMKKKEWELKTIIGNNSLIRSHSVIYAGNKIGDNFQTGNNVNIREENIIGNNVSIGTKTVIEYKTKIEDKVRLHSQVFIPEYCILKKDCWLGPNVVLTNAKYPNSSRSKEFLEGIVIEEKAIIGANTTILPGIRIGKKALIGAGSLVNKNIPDGKVAVGNPVKIINEVKNLKYSNGDIAYK